MQERKARALPPFPLHVVGRFRNLLHRPTHASRPRPSPQGRAMTSIADLGIFTIECARTHTTPSPCLTSCTYFRLYVPPILIFRIVIYTTDLALALTLTHTHNDTFRLSPITTYHSPLLIPIPKPHKTILKRAVSSLGYSGTVQGTTSSLWSSWVLRVSAA